MSKVELYDMVSTLNDEMKKVDISIIKIKMLIDDIRKHEAYNQLDSVEIKGYLDNALNYLDDFFKLVSTFNTPK